MTKGAPVPAPGASAPSRPRGPGWLREVPLALVLALIGLVSLPFIGRDRSGWGPESGDGPPFAGHVDGTTPDAIAAVLVAMAAVALLMRRRQPVWTLTVTTGATALYLALGYPYGPILLSLFVAIYSLARHHPTRPAALWATAAFVALLVHLLTHPPGSALGAVVPTATWVALPFTIGLARHLVADARTRARTEADERLVQAERLRLAQEVHDVVGHGLAAIQMQADIALHVRGTRPGQPEEALRAISAASEEALEELRSTLSTIRPDASTASDDSRAPTPGTAGLDALCDRVRAAGVEVDLELTGDDDILPAATDLAVYRIVQESLTNVVKHSAHPRAEVRVHRDATGVKVTVTNEDLAPEGHVAGFGIAGMRRRAGQLGGALSFGPGPRPHTFRIHATLPLPRPEEKT